MALTQDGGEEDNDDRRGPRAPGGNLVAAAFVGANGRTRATWAVLACVLLSVAISALCVDFTQGGAGHCGALSVLLDAKDKFVW
jgi:hypothetical protein